MSINSSSSATLVPFVVVGIVEEKEEEEEDNKNYNIHILFLLLLLPLIHTVPMYSLLIPIVSLVGAAEGSLITIFVQRSMGNQYPLARIFSPDEPGGRGSG